MWECIKVRGFQYSMKMGNLTVTVIAWKHAWPPDILVGLWIRRHNYFFREKVVKHGREVTISYPKSILCRAFDFDWILLRCNLLHSRKLTINMNHCLSAWFMKCLQVRRGVLCKGSTEASNATLQHVSFSQLDDTHQCEWYHHPLLESRVNLG